MYILSKCKITDNKISDLWKMDQNQNVIYIIMSNQSVYNILHIESVFNQTKKKVKIQEFKTSSEHKFGHEYKQQQQKKKNRNQHWYCNSGNLGINIRETIVWNCDYTSSLSFFNKKMTNKIFRKCFFKFMGVRKWIYLLYSSSLLRPAPTGWFFLCPETIQHQLPVTLLELAPMPQQTDPRIPLPTQNLL